jgi:hypothetical protein
MSRLALRPTSSRVSPRLCGAALLGAFTLLAAGCGGSGGSSSVTGEPISFQELSRSATRSAEATSGRFAFDMALTFPGAEEPFALSGEGAFDAASQRASFAVDMSSLAKLIGAFVTGLAAPNASDLPDFDDPEGWKIEVIQDGDVGYVRLPALDEQLPEGKSWIRGTEGVSAGGFDFEELEQFGTSDPREVLDALQAVTSEIETVGSEELRGVETTHYHAVLDPVKLAQAKDLEGPSAPESLVERLSEQGGLDEIPVDVWLDASGLVRKLSLSFVATDPGTSQTSSAKMSFELWDYGEAVDIALPPTSQVVDASAVGA